jgi:hypothetical protein
MSINFVSLTSSALGFALAMTWCDAISKNIKSFYPSKDDHATITKVTLTSAIITTILVIIVVFSINNTNKYFYRNRASFIHNNTATPLGLKGGAPASPSPVCRDCAAKCGLVFPIVRLWTPN